MNTVFGPEQIADLVQGAVSVDVDDGFVRVHRLDPHWAHQWPNDFVRMVEEQAAGVRLRLATDASAITLRLDSYRSAPVGAPAPDPGEFDLVINGQYVGSAFARECGMMNLAPLSGHVTVTQAPTTDVTFDLEASSGWKQVDIWLPHSEVARLRSLEVDGSVEPAEPVSLPRWVHYGSSISHGASAGHPTGIWPVIAARSAGFDLTNLGLSGNATLDSFAARTIAELPSDVISLKVGINIVNNNCLSARTFGPNLHNFLDIVRASHPTTPILVVSALACPIVEDRPGPTVLGKYGCYETLGTPADRARGMLSLSDTRQWVSRVVAARQDPHMKAINGLTWFGLSDAIDIPMGDGLHPGDEAHRVIGERAAVDLRKLINGE